MKLQIKGISRYQSSINTNPEGSCDEIINIRRKDGQWKLLYKKDVEYDLTTLDHVNDMILWYKHPITATKLFICYDTNSNKIKEIDAFTITENTLLTLSDSEECTKIYHFGHILIIVTDIDVYFIKYDPDDGSYTVLPPLEHGLYAVSSQKQYETYGNGTWKTAEVTTTGNDSGYVNTISNLRKVINDYEKQGYCNGHTLFRFGFKMVDGSVLMPTSPYYYPLGMQRYNGDTDYTADYEATAHVEGTSDGAYAKWGYFVFPKITLLFTPEQLNTIQLYQELISKFVVYMTKPVKDRDENANSYKDLIWVADHTTTIKYVFKENNINDFLKETKSFYEVHEIDIKSLKSITVSIIRPGDINTIETKRALDIDNFTAHKYFSQALYEYNSRLHIGNVTVKLNGGYNMTIRDNLDINVPSDNDEQLNLLTDLSDPIYVGDGNTAPDEWDVYAITTLVINNSTKYVIKKYDKIAIYKDGASGTERYMFLNAFISYPDERATNIKYVCMIGAEFRLLVNLDLTKHTYLNFAYNDKESFRYLNNNSLHPGIGLRVFKYRSVELVTTGTVVTFSLNNLYQDTNRIQVSQVNNPFYYPAKNSYQIGSMTNIIKGMMSQAVPMSTGQYGYYPLIVFSTEGVFALEQGSGEILYKSIQPVSLDVCNDTDSIISINGGILFASDKGLMVLHGREVDEISKTVEGDPKLDIQADTNYISAISGTVTNLSGAIDSTEFKTYLRGSKIAYDLFNDEIIISNNSYGYSYVFSVIEKMWYKTDQVFSDFIVNVPNWLGLSGNKIYSLANENSLKEPQEFLIKTNAFKFNDAFKSILRLAMRFNGKFQHLPNKFVALYVYGSLNGTDWKLITGVNLPHESDNVKNSFAMLRKIRTTAKYFIIFLASSGAYEFTLDGFDMDVKEKMKEKVR